METVRKKPLVITAAQIRKIKALQRTLGLDDDTYRDMLRSVGRVSSCTELAGAAIEAVIKHLERRGKGNREKGTGKNKKITNPSSLLPSPCGDMATIGQIAKITALWHAVSRAPEEKRAAALRLFLKRRFGVDSLNWLDQELAVKVIEGLKIMAERAGVLDD